MCPILRRNVNSRCERIEFYSLNCSNVASESAQVAARKLKRRFINVLVDVQTVKRDAIKCHHVAIKFFDYKIEMAIIIRMNTRNRHDALYAL